MKDKLQWLKGRQCGIGGSDVGAILGVNKYKTPFEVYLEKTEPITEVPKQSEAARQGTDFEDYVATRFMEETGKKVRRDRRHFKHKEYPFMVANIDRRIVGENAILECKTATPFVAQEWEGEEIPASYLLQCQHYMAVTGADKAYIACLIYGTDFVWREIQRDEELIEIIIQAEKEFWKMVQNKTPPALDGSSAAEKYLTEKYAKAEEGKVEQLGFEYKDKIKTYLELKEQIKTLERQAKEIENQIKHELKDAEYGFTPGYSISWKNITSNRVDTEALKKKYAEVYKEVCKSTTSRRFNIKEDK